MKTIRNYKILIPVALVILALTVGVVVARRSYWLFTPAYSQKNLTDNFLNDISKGQPTVAYGLTSNGYKKNTSYDSFYTQAKKLEYSKISIKNTNYVTTAAKTSIAGTINDMTAGKKLVFYINIVKSKSGYSVDSMVIGPEA